MSHRSESSLLFVAVCTVIALFASAHAAYGQCVGIQNCALVWSDEFDGTSVDTGKWEFQNGTGTDYGLVDWGNAELQYYRSENATVANGMLTIQAKQQSFGGRSYTSSRMRTLGTGDFRYGRFEMRAQLPVGQGMWPAFWMLPTDGGVSQSGMGPYGGWAASGEIDIMESIGTTVVFGTIHYGDEDPGNVYSGASVNVPGSTSGFHVYAIEWEPTEIRWYIDGNLYSTKTNAEWFSANGPDPAPFDVDFHLLLNLAVGGNFPGNPNGSTVFPQSFMIDYVRVYQEAPPDPEKAADCEISKVKETGKYAKCRAIISSKAIKKSISEDASKLISCAGKLTAKFIAAEAKAGGSCPTDGDSSSMTAAVDSCIGDAVTALGGIPGPGGDEAKCQAKKVKEIGKYAACRFKATFKGLKKGSSPDFGKCVAKLTKKWTKIETKPCSTLGDRSVLQADADVCHATLIGTLGGPGCGNNAVDLGEECDDGNTADGDGCSAVCLLEAEYVENFESLVQSNPAALSNEGWLAFGNVFDPSGTIYLGGYGAFGAPNDPGSPAFSLIASGQGGLEQGGQQIVVFSDYNNSTDHGLGNRIESIVYRERSIVAADVGNTVTFEFDSKRGDLAGASTAMAFIKTLDPNNGFATTNLAPLDTTAIPTTWGSFSISLDLTAGLEGQLLQYGFANKASNFEASGVFYDNLIVSLTATP